MKNLQLRSYYSNTRYHILNAAFSLFNEKPLNSITVTEISRVSGKSIGAIQRHFKNINGLLNALALEVLSEIDEKVYKVTLDRSLSFKEQLEQLIELPYDFPEHFSLLNQVHVLAKNNPILLPFTTKLNDARNQLFHFFKENIENEQKNNPRLHNFNSNDLAILIYSNFEGIYINTLPSDAQFSKETLLNNIALFFYNT